MVTYIMFVGYSVLVTSLLILRPENAEIDHELINEIMQITCL